MSYIHEALKKAQKEKDALHGKYRRIVSTSGYKAKFFSGKGLWWTFSLVITLAFTTYLWLPSKGTQLPVNEPEMLEAIPDPGPERFVIDKLEPPEAIPDLEPENLLIAVGLYEKAKHFQKSGRLQEAKRFYKKTLNVDPDYVDALNNIGVIHIHDRRYAAARNSFEKAIELEPDYVDPYYNLACLHAIQGKVAEGLMYLKKAILLDPSAKDWARSDTDLQNLRGVPGFEEIIGSNGVVG